LSGWSIVRDGRAEYGRSALAADEKEMNRGLPTVLLLMTPDRYLIQIASFS
jgi:hypothetical protein